MMLAVIAARAQVITGCEYFFNTDPGIGNGTPLSVTSGDSVEIMTNIPTSGLPDGFHRLFVRVRNTDGKWSLYEGRTFHIQTPPTPNLAQLIEAEYFFDTDPGVGNATPFSVTAGDSLDFSSIISTTALSSGFHRLFVRALNADGIWSHYEGRTLYIYNIPTPNTAQLTAAEYFFDTDPGVGNATAFSVTPGDSLDWTATVNTAGLGSGFHNLFVRVKNADERWSLYEGRSFYILENVVNPNLPQLDMAEYFFDTDPGIGNGIPLAITTGDSIDGNFIVPQTPSQGAHLLVIRVRNTDSRWSANEGREFLVGWPSVPEIDPNNPTLFQNYPNPFSNHTTIEFNLVKADDAILRVTDVLGKNVLEINLPGLKPGSYSVPISKADLPAGCYTYYLLTQNYTTAKQMVVVK
jgi:hypothetical protein